MHRIKNLRKGIFGSFMTFVMLSSTIFSVMAASADMSQVEMALAKYPDGNILKVGEPQTFPFSVEKDGIYEVEVVYEVQTNKSITPQMGYSLDEEYHKNADNMTDMPIKWRNDMDTDRFRKDKMGNELLPSQVAVGGVQKKRIPIENAVENGINVLKLTKGQHTLSLCMLRESIKIQEILLVKTDDIICYDDYLAKNNNDGTKNTTEQSIHQEAEITFEKSHREIIVSYDRTTPSISPNHPTQMRYNILGGAGFAAEGQWVSWKFDVKQSGYYNLDFIYRQNISSGMESRRRILIDDKVAFKELDCVTFARANDFTSLTLADSQNNPYKIYLSEGMHEIKMEVVLSEVKPVLAEMKEIISELNKLYSKIMIIVGETPDLFRDYDLQVSVDNLNEVLDSCNQRLQKLVESLKTDDDKNSSNTARILETARMLGDLSSNPQDIPKRLDNFRSKINMLSDLIGEMRAQPLELDYLVLRSPSVVPESGKKGFFEVIKFRLLSFFSSFVNDYSVVDVNNDFDAEPLTVWVSTSDLSSGTYGVGRDQAQIINQLSIDTFSQKTGIPVNISLINSNNTLLPAIVSGKGPDCALFVPRTVYTNLYFRNALTDLRDMPNFDEIEDRFYESAFVSLKDGDKVFGLPEVQTYNMMYYRTDIFQEYGFTPPKTWEEFYALTAVLQKKGMQTGIAESPQIFEMFLLQNGGSLYSDDMSKTNLMQQSSVDAFTAWTDIYVKYGLPKAFDPLSRFRTGQIPLLLASSSFYGQLCVGAPEISNQWAMLPIPGTVDENGKINRKESCNITASIVLNSSKRQKDSYSFIDWWTTTETQTRFGFESESQIGVSARYFPANKQVVEMLGWTGDEQKALLQQWEEVGDVPQSLATYFMTRNLTNAFRRVVYDNETPRDVIYRYGRMVDDELFRKRKEFGLAS